MLFWCAGGFLTQTLVLFSSLEEFQEEFADISKEDQVNAMNEEEKKTVISISNPPHRSRNSMKC